MILLVSPHTLTCAKHSPSLCKAPHFLANPHTLELITATLTQIPSHGQSAKELSWHCVFLPHFVPFNLVAALYNRWASISDKLQWDLCKIIFYRLLDAQIFRNDKCFTANTKHNNDFAISWKVLPIYLWFQRNCTSLSVWKYELLLMRSTQRLFYVGQRMFPPCPFNMFPVKFCVLPLGPCTCWWYACKLHSKFFLLPSRIIISTLPSALQWNHVPPYIFQTFLSVAHTVNHCFMNWITSNLDSKLFSTW